MKKLCLLLCMYLCALHTAAALDAQSAELRVLNWNVQTFFDAVKDGTEYAEFKGSKSRWNEKAYMARVERLGSALKALDADVVVLEELEKEAQLHDIYNQLAGTFRFSKLYAYGCFVSEPGASIGCGVLSRYPLDGVRVHSLDIGTESGLQPAMRPLLELCVHKDGRVLLLFVCHWKSKLGADSAIWRAHQERLLADCMSAAVHDGIPALACGDFNQDVLEFALVRERGKERSLAPFESCTPSAFSADGTEGKKTLPAANVVFRGSEPLLVYSPWLSAADVYADGSYWYKGAWERIDNFFVCGKACLRDFCVERSGDWADADGHPVRYEVWSGAGYSDHLPISCMIAF